MEYLTVAEVAKRLRLHEMTVRRHIKSGRIRAHHAGRRIRIPQSEVESFVSPLTPQAEMSPEELKQWVFREPTREEIARRRDWVASIKSLQRPSDIDSGTLVRVSRREEEVIYGDKTWEELIAEES